MSDIATKLTTIAENQQKVYDAGYTKGKAAGGDTDAAYQQGVIDGKQAEHDAFWNEYQNYGNRTNWNNAFSQEGWKNDLFRPKYDIVIHTADHIFYNSAISGDLRSLLNSCNVSLDTENMTSATYAFSNTAMTHLPPIDMRKTTNANSIFRTSQKLVSIDELKVSENTDFTNAFMYCGGLKELMSVVGTIGKSINFNWSPLSVVSMKNIISCLKDLTGTAGEGVYSIQFSSACWDALEADGSKPADLVDAEGNYVLKVPIDYDITQFPEETWITYVRDVLKWAI